MMAGWNEEGRTQRRKTYNKEMRRREMVSRSDVKLNAPATRLVDWLTESLPVAAAAGGLMDEADSGVPTVTVSSLEAAEPAG